jgi:hypothetical protein
MIDSTRDPRRRGLLRGGLEITFNPFGALALSLLLAAGCGDKNGSPTDAGLDATLAESGAPDGPAGAEAAGPDASGEAGAGDARLVDGATLDGKAKDGQGSSEGKPADAGLSYDAALSICQSATAITLTSGTGTASGEVKSTATTSVANLANGDCTGKGTPGSEAFFSVNLTAGTSTFVKVVPSSGYNVSLYVFTDCGSIAGSCVIGADTQYAGSAEQLKFTPKKTGKYYIAVDSPYTAGASYSYGTFTVTVETYTPPINDTCAWATSVPLVLGKGKVSNGDTTYASDDVDLSASGCTGNVTVGADVFYSFSVTSGLSYKVALKPDSTFNGSLYVFTSCSSVASSCTKGSDSGFAGQHETLIFEASSSGTALVGVDSPYADGSSYSSGTFTLEIEEFTPPSNTDCSSPETLSFSGGSASSTGDTSYSQNEFSGVNCGGVYAFSGAQLYYRAKLTQSKQYLVQVKPVSTYDVALYAFKASTACKAAAINNGCASIYVDDEGVGKTEYLRLIPTATEEWVFVVDSTSSSESGSFSITVEELVTPSNDSCGSAETLTWVGPWISKSAYTIGASNDVSLTSSGCTGSATAGPDVFYAISLKAGKTYAIELDGIGSWDESLYLFTSCSNVSGTCGSGMGADDYYTSPETVTFTPTATGTYYLGVDGKGSTDEGLFTLTVREKVAPSNDTCASAQSLTYASGGVSVMGDTTSADDSVDLGSSGCTGYSSLGADVFYSITLSPGTYVVTLTPSPGFDAMLYVFTSCSNPETTCVDGSDSIGAGTVEKITLTTTTTTTYFIGVDSYTATEYGTFTLEVK